VTVAGTVARRDIPDTPSAARRRVRSVAVPTAG
jgi:hypothetical protein